MSSEIPAESASSTPPPAPAPSATPGTAPSPAPSAARGSGWATACHLVGLLDFGVSFLFVGVLATLVVWLARKDEDPECDFHGKEALNFQLNLLGWQLLALPLICCCLIGLPLLVALPFVKLVAMLVAAARAASGERWSYPLIVRLVR